MEGSNKGVTGFYFYGKAEPNTTKQPVIWSCQGHAALGVKTRGYPPAPPLEGILLGRSHCGSPP